jgi:hypothetical protein
MVDLYDEDFEGEADYAGKSEEVDVGDPKHSDLLIALGSLVVSSAKAENDLRFILYEVAGIWEDAFIFIEGESVTYLLDKIRVLAGDPYQLHPRPDCKELQSLCDELKRSFAERNRFIHAAHRVMPNGVYLTERSRRHVFSSYAPFTLEEVENLSARLNIQGNELYRKFRKRTEDKIADFHNKENNES